ncbi:unnamed protein product [Prunus brigantina]
MPPVVLPSGEMTPINATSTISLNSYLYLKDVLCVPTFHVNLMYVSKLTKGLNCSVTFFPSCCYTPNHLLIPTSVFLVALPMLLLSTLHTNLIIEQPSVCSLVILWVKNPTNFTISPLVKFLQANILAPLPDAPHDTATHSL